MLNETSEPNLIGSTHIIRMTPHVLKQYKESIASNEPETFALLGGSIIDDPFLITDFHFLPPKTDAKGSYVASGSYVYPDHEMLNYIIDRVLARNGRYMIGLWHSHPGRFNMPSHQDLTYCSQILANDDSPGRRWSYFLAPITTFDDTGRDAIKGWILPKGGSAFKSATVITHTRGEDEHKQIHEAKHEDNVGPKVVRARRRSSATHPVGDIDAEILELTNTVEADLKAGVASLTYMEKYHARRKLAEVRLKIKCRYI